MRAQINRRLRAYMRNRTLKLMHTQALRVLLFARRLTSSIRLLPDFIIIGAQKCGTSSLYSYLKEHPCIAPAIYKEVHFFDINFKKGNNWYRAHFPSILYKKRVKYLRNQNIITGEASPYYLFYPHAPQRIFSINPGIKIIVLLRNPVDRAYSQYYHNVARGRETLPFEVAIKKENERLRGEVEKMMKDKNYFSYNHIYFSYLSRGIYVDQLKRWYSIFPKKQILVLKSEDFFEDTSRIYNKVLSFLQLSNFELKKYQKYNVGQHPSMNAKLRKQLFDFFKPHNQRLYDYLGYNFAWNN